MKGLLYKDFLLMLKVCKSYLLIMAVFSVVGCFSQSYGFMGAVFSTVIPLTLIAYDEHDRWDVYFQTLPVTKSDYVCAKYLTGFIMNAISILVFIAAKLLYPNSRENVFIYAAVILSVSLIIQSFSLPVVFKYGSVKGRIVNIILVVAVCVFCSLAFSGLEYTDIVNISSGSQTIGAAIISIIAAAIYALSWLVSIKVYKKREL